MKIRIAIADDHPLMMRGLQYILSGHNDIRLAGSYIGSTDLLKGLASQQVDVLVLDIHLSDQPCDDLALQISEQYPYIKVLVLTTEDCIYRIKNMLSRGVAGYLLKSTSEDMLLDAVRTLHCGGQYLEPALKELVIKNAQQAKKQLSAQPALSDREKEVLRYIALDLTSQQMAEKIFVSKRTIDYYRLCLLTKLGVKNVGALVKKGMQLGYI
jgi:DNA-binding NarL/FixJ family response regulator